MKLEIDKKQFSQSIREYLLLATYKSKYFIPEILILSIWF